MPSFCAATAIGPTGNPTIPNMYLTPCCLRLLAIRVAPSTSAISSLLSEWANAKRTARRGQPTNGAQANLGMPEQPEGGRPFPAVWSLPPEERLGLHDLGPLGVGLLGQREKLAVIRPRLLQLAGLLGGPGRAVEAAEAVRIVPLRALELGEGWRRPTEIEQQACQHLAGREQRAGRHGMFFGPILAVSGLPHERDRLVAATFRARHPAGDRQPLNLALLGPVRVLRRRE